MQKKADWVSGVECLVCYFLLTEMIVKNTPVLEIVPFVFDLIQHVAHFS